MDKLTLWRNIERCLDARKPTWREQIAHFGHTKANARREADEAWRDNDVFEALVVAVLSNNNDWSKVESVLPDLGKLLQGFDLRAYAKLPEADVVDVYLPWFTTRKAGSMTLKRDLINLIETAERLARYSRERGTADGYFTSLVRECQGDPKQAAFRLGTDPSIKFPSVGVPLAAETLRNLGFDVAKPDRHVMRAVGCFGLVGDLGVWSTDSDLRTGNNPPNPTPRRHLAAMRAVEEIATSVNESVILVDGAIWLLCAKGGLNLSNEDLEQLANGGSADGLIALVESWMQDDPDEQRETLACLIRGLDENRPPGQKLFPKELKGRTW